MLSFHGKCTVFILIKSLIFSGIDNDVAIDLIVKHIEDILRTPRTNPDKDAQNKPLAKNNQHSILTTRPR